MDLLFFYYIILTESYDTWDEVVRIIVKPVDWIAKATKKTEKTGHKFEFEIFRSSMDD